MVAKSDLGCSFPDQENNCLDYNNQQIKAIENTNHTMEEEKYQPTLIQKAYSSTCELISETAEYLASFSLGQTVLRQTDRALWTVEKCAEWSVPTQPPNKHHHQNGTFGKPGPLIRPLPWIFFLPMLITLRCFRLSLNIASFLLGFESVKAISMVRFIQVRRRKIRALKFLGLRRIRQHKMAREHSAKNRMTVRERFYNVMSRAMCFRVTNSDLYEEITVKKEELEQAAVPKATRQRSITGRDLKRKYIEILKNNYYDWEDVEDDEELIDRITQLAEDDMENEDPDFVPAEDSATEDDSMSDAEEDTIPTDVASPVASSPKPVQRLSSHSSLANETIEEENENEDSDSTTVSANSDDESSQNIEKQETPQKEKEMKNLEPSSTSDEFFSPINSIPASPEPKPDLENTCHNQNQNNTQKTEENKDSLNADNQVTVNSQNSRPITSRDTNHGVPGKNNVNSHSPYSPRMKKHKHRRRFANILRRKRK